MNKRYLIAAMAAALTLTTGVVMANPVELDGSASYRFRADDNKGNVLPADNGDKDGSIYKVILNAKSEVAPNLSVYARLGILGLTTSNVGRDTNESGDFVGGIDQYGLLYKNAGFSYKVGRQSATIGATALLYNDNFRIGKKGFVDGVTVKGMSGVTTLDAIAAQEDRIGSDDNKLYAVHASYSPAKNWVVGTTLAKYDAAVETLTKKDTINYAVDAAYTMGKATVFGEFLKSDYSTDNKSYDLGVSYAFDKKNSAYIINFNNEQFADMGQSTDFENGFKGFYYGVDHKFTSDTSASLFFRDMEALSDSAIKNTSFRATVNYSF